MEIRCGINKGDHDHLEKVQRRATKVVTEIRDLPYQDTLWVLKLPSLRYRRERGDMLQTYKILHRLEDMALDTTRGHSMKLQKSRCKTAPR